MNLRPILALLALAALLVPVTATPSLAAACKAAGGSFNFERYFPKTKKLEHLGRITLSKRIADDSGATKIYVITGYDDPNERYWEPSPYAGSPSFSIMGDVIDQKAMGYPIDAKPLSYVPKYVESLDQTVFQGQKVFNEGTPEAFVHWLIPRGPLADCEKFSFAVN